MSILLGAGTQNHWFDAHADEDWAPACAGATTKETRLVEGRNGL